MADKTICRADGCVNASELDDLPYCRPHLDALVSGLAPVKIAVAHCTADGCQEKTRSAFSPYCHMHDARLRRHGSCDRKPMAEVLSHSHGYRLVLAPGHPMARGQRAYEHRKVYFDEHPDGPEDCRWCGIPLTWETLQVDHLNAIRDDNRPENLTAACGPCNRDRAKPAAVIAHRNRARKYMVNGRWLSIDDAAKNLGVNRSSILARLNGGWSIERAMTERRGKTGPARKETI